jgi:DNA-binding LacI/PurR family transcriptional regulator
MATLKDVAKLCGVSAMTVSDVLNGKTGAASEQTRRRVQAAAAQLGYLPNAVARGLRQGRMNTLGVVVIATGSAFLEHSYHGGVLRGIIDVSFQRRQAATLFHGEYRSNSQEGLPVYCDGRCDGLLLIAPPEGSNLTDSLARRDTPFVLIGELGHDPLVTAIDVDSRAAARSAVSYLLEQGHRRIAGLYFLEQTASVVKSRLLGYRDALDAWGIVYDERLVKPTSASPDVLEVWGVPTEQATVRFADNARDLAVPLRAPIAELLSLPDTERPTAIFCFTDEVATLANRILADMGVRVPDDISLVGFDDQPDVRHLNPPLTTIRQDPYAIGARATELLLALIDGDLERGHKEVAPTELVVRESVKRR